MKAIPEAGAEGFDVDDEDDDKIDSEVNMHIRRLANFYGQRLRPSGYVRNVGCKDDLSGAWSPIVVQSLLPHEHKLSQNNAEALL